MKFRIITLFVITLVCLGSRPKDQCQQAMEPSQKQIIQEIVNLVLTTQQSFAGADSVPKESNPESSWRSTLRESLLQTKKLELEKQYGKAFTAALFQQVHQDLRRLANDSDPEAPPLPPRKTLVRQIQVKPTLFNFHSLAPANVIHFILAPDGQSYLGLDYQIEGSHQLVLWDAVFGDLKSRFDWGNFDPAFVYSAEFSPDSQSIVTADLSNRLLLWDVDTGTIKKQLTHSTWLASVRPHLATFSPDGKTVASTTLASMFNPETNYSVTVRKVSSKWFSRRIPSRLNRDRHREYLTAINYSPDGQKIATASEDRTAKVWDLKTGQMLFALLGHGDRVNDVRFSPDGRFIATGSSDGLVRLWNAENGALMNTLVVQGSKSPVLALTWSPNSQYLVSSQSFSIVRFWDIKTGKLLHGWKAEINLDGLDRQGTFFTPDGRYLHIRGVKSLVIVYKLFKETQIEVDLGEE